MPEPLFAKDVYAAVGEVMMQWGLVEAEMASKLAITDRRAIMQRWRDAGLSTPHIEELARFRNLLAHGLHGGQALPEDGEARVICIDVQGVRQPLSIAQLQGAARDMYALAVSLHRRR